MTRVVIAGALANKAGQGGESWVRLSWVQGLRSLGFDTHLVEVLSPHAPACGADYFGRVVDRFGLDATLLAGSGDDGRDEPIVASTAGLTFDAIADLVADAAVLFDISGHLAGHHLIECSRRRVFVDLDPGFTQAWHRAGLMYLGGYDRWYTVGLSVGRPGCRVPAEDMPWRPVLPPVDLAEWPDVSSRPPGRGFTTIANWRGSSGTIEVDGCPLGGKAREFRRLVGLPSLLTVGAELAIAIDPADDADRIALDEHGWTITDPTVVAGTPDRFRRYVQDSFAELSVAQEMYVASRSGWFSDRTTRYLASGRPAVVQDTGFSRHLPVGDGLLCFDDLAGAAAAAKRVIAAPEHHAAAARQIAQEWFASDVVLGTVCEELDLAP